MRVLAIDPGYDRMGVAVIEGDPSRPTVVWSDCIIPPKGAKEERLGVILVQFERALAEFAPDAIAVESLFFSKNVTTAIGVAEARGVVLAVAGKSGIHAIECSPQEVKLAVTGYGAADKAAVMNMVPKLVVLPPKKRLDDELDAIALGIAALTKRR